MTGPELKELRMSMGLSARALGELIGVRTRSVYKWERGERQISPMVINLVAVLWASRQPKEAIRGSRRSRKNA